MKWVLNILRWVVGITFIFSGLIKADDPLGLSYKMLEFFEAWGFHFFDNYTLAASIIMNIFEVLAGVALIVGWQMRFFSWFLLGLILFFTYLTAYVLFSGKIKECGCFGNCIPLSGIQTFIKDIILLLMILLLLLNAKHIHPWLNNTTAPMVLFGSIVASLLLQVHVLKHLPFFDCLPYKKGSNLIEEMKVPQGAIADSFSIVFKYKKNQKIVEFNQAHFPADFDSTYEFIDRFDKLIRKGNAEPLISDFNLRTIAGNDTTAAILPLNAIWFMCKDFDRPTAYWKEQFNMIDSLAKLYHLPLFVITALPDEASTIFLANKVSILKCDATVIKTAARVQPTYFLMQQGTVISKYSYADVAIFKNTVEKFMQNK